MSTEDLSDNDMRELRTAADAAGLASEFAELERRASSAAAVPAKEPKLTGDALLAHQQCRAVAHMARALAEVHDARCLILESGADLAEVIGTHTAYLMEKLGDHLNSMDAADDDDEWMDSVFEEAQKRWPVAATPAPPQAAVQGWIPIETAPKTSTARLVWCPDRKNIYVVGWDARDDGSWRHFGGGNTLTEEPTHWMPLPPTPEAAPPHADHFPDAREMVAPQAVPATSTQGLGISDFLDEFRRVFPDTQGPVAQAVLATDAAVPTEEMAGLSWDGFDIHGTVSSIREVQRLIHEDARAKEIAAPVAVDAAPELPLLPVPVHPDDHMVWTKVEREAIEAYGERYARAALRAAGAGSREPLTEEQIMAAFDDAIPEYVDISDAEVIDFARAIERAQGIGGKA